MTAAIATAESDPEPRIETAAFVLGLRARGISDLPLLRAMETVPRHLFAPRRYGDLSRQDVALPLACGETMTAPSTVALMLAAAGIQPGQRLLEIGTGSGYVTALLAALGAAIHTIERRAVLLDGAWHRLRAVGLAESCAVDCRDGLAPDESAQRYDRILVNGAFDQSGPPSSLTSRLAVGGRLVCGRTLGPGATQLVVISRDESGDLSVKFGAPVRLSRI